MKQQKKLEKRKKNEKFKLTGTSTIQDLAAEVVNNYAALIQKAEPFTMVIAGASDKDKKDLIHGLFGTNTVNTISGIPACDGRIKIYHTGNMPLTVNDVFISEDAMPEEAACDLLSVSGKEISCILYCVRDFSDHDQKIIRKVYQKAEQKTRIFVVLFAADEHSAQKEKIEAMHLPVSGVCTIYSHRPDETSMNYSVYAGLNELSLAIHDSLPENVSRTYTLLQKPCITLNNQMADEYIAKAIVPAGVGGLIPFGKTYLGVQVPMLAGITMSYGLPANKMVATIILCAMAGVTTGTMCLTEWIKNLIGEIPDDYIGMTILKAGLSAGTSAVITYAIGETYKVVLGKLRNETWTYADLNTEKVKKLIRDLFDEQKDFKELENGI